MISMDQLFGKALNVYSFSKIDFKCLL